MRRSGRTTRLVDFYIQELFKGVEITVKDHIDTDDMHRYVFKKIIQRLGFEHFRGNTLKDSVKYNIKELTISLNDDR